MKYVFTEYHVLPTWELLRHFGMLKAWRTFELKIFFKNHTNKIKFFLTHFLNLFDYETLFSPIFYCPLKSLLGNTSTINIYFLINRDFFLK